MIGMDVCFVFFPAGFTLVFPTFFLLVYHLGGFSEEKLVSREHVKQIGKTNKQTTQI